MQQEPPLSCLWIMDDQHLCNQQFQYPGDLFDHLTQDHIGRKATGILNLKCSWFSAPPQGSLPLQTLFSRSCDHTVNKRDHIVSHIRTHIPSYKPFECQQCGKSFSRNQDLKKHGKTHEPNHLPKRQHSMQQEQEQATGFFDSIKRRKMEPTYTTKVKNHLNSLVQLSVGSEDEVSFDVVNGKPQVQHSPQIDIVEWISGDEVSSGDDAPSLPNGVNVKIQNFIKDKEDVNVFKEFLSELHENIKNDEGFESIVNVQQDNQEENKSGNHLLCKLNQSQQADPTTPSYNLVLDDRDQLTQEVEMLNHPPPANAGMRQESYDMYIRDVESAIKPKYPTGTLNDSMSRNIPGNVIQQKPQGGKVAPLQRNSFGRFPRQQSGMQHPRIESLQSESPVAEKLDIDKTGCALSLLKQLSFNNRVERSDTTPLQLLKQELRSNSMPVVELAPNTMKKVHLSVIEQLLEEMEDI